MKNKKKKEGKTNSYLVFTLEDELFAINVKKVLSIEKMKDITHIPQSEPHMKGIMNLRGEIIPIIDSHEKFGLSGFNFTMKSGILILHIKWSQYETIKLGFTVDKINEVIQIPKSKILPPPEIGDSYKSKYVTGVYQKKSDSGLIMLLDIEKALSINELFLIDKINEEKEQATQKESNELLAQALV